MRRTLTGLVIAALALGATWNTPTHAAVTQRQRPRNVYCHYRDLDVPRWTDREVQATIRCAAERFGVYDVSHAMYVANRESGFSWWAENPFSGTCGIFQHMPRYWPGRVATFRQRHPFWTINPSCFNVRSNVLVTLDMVRHGGWGPWGG